MTPDRAKPVRLQLARVKGFNLQRLSQETNGLECVNVARPSKWGNPFKVGACIGIDSAGKQHFMTAEQAIERYRKHLRHWVWKASENSLYLPELTGKNLACWCELGSPCHADVLLELANSNLSTGGEP